MALPGANPNPPALAGLHYFGVVQTIFGDRAADWVDFYRYLFGPGGAGARARSASAESDDKAVWAREIQADCPNGACPVV